ncbi:hypothetical protein LTR50_005646 [Elasticomyces elasticus]|nr:hypothetical protein LTR50_005646 [Elasticomyces elasticus]
MFSDAELAKLQPWVIKRLEDVSDADADVLADYVLALVVTDESDEVVKRNYTASFVDELLAEMKKITYESNRSAARDPPSPFNPNSTAAGGQSSFQTEQVTSQNGNAQQSRKRGYTDWDATEPANEWDAQYGRGPGAERPQKQMRRGGDRRQDQRGGRPSQPSPMAHNMTPMAAMSPHASALPTMPTPPPGMPPLDPNNPFGALLAMQAMGFPLSGMPNMPFAGSPTGLSLAQPNHPYRRAGQRCHDYDNKGFCARGASCPYDHGNDAVIATPGMNIGSEEYDPTNAALMNVPNAQNGYIGSTLAHPFSETRGSFRGRGRGCRTNYRYDRGKRAEFSQAGPNFDRSATTVVIEQIPEDKFNETAVRDFFSEFGTIEEVTMQELRRLAIIRYSDHAAARRAYDSPKVIFDNRFVKVFWYKTGTLPQPSPYTAGGNGENPKDRQKLGNDEDMGVDDTPEEEKPIDPAEFAKKQEEAQRAHEAKLVKLKEAETQRADLEKKVKAQADERAKLLERLAVKTKAKVDGVSGANGNGQNADGKANAADDKKNVSTERLRAKLAELKKLAESIGLPPDDDTWGGMPTRGRGGSRGHWRPYASRGVSVFSHARGGRGGAVMRLDNRPKTVAVVFPNGEQFDAGKEEALRQYVLFVSHHHHRLLCSAPLYSFEPTTMHIDIDPVRKGDMDITALVAHPTRSDAAAISFKERYAAENFLAAHDIPNIGKVELSWLPNSVPAQEAKVETKKDNANGDVDMGNMRQDIDFDVADDDVY